ncbi:MAG: pyruvate dehydrogenase (acetyl-transferring) E1 component subunit alpha [Polyangiaceae bacterium]|nr:pyruvate dehydrogenase (acetyl-transferring) E1 component subunit alpha [Polyangiaceae bacterium]
MTSAAHESIYTAALSDDDVVRVLGPDGSLDARNDPGLSPEEVVHLYRHMVLTRLVDDRLVTLQRQGRIGFHIGSLGEEAAIIGSAYALRKQDWLFPCYREFGAALLRGMQLERYIDNMFGNANDPVKGRQMPDHYTCKAAQFGSVSSPIGTQITQAVGFAWAAKIQKRDLVALTYFGEGATSSNEFHNGLNFAGVFKAPTVFLCRNNGWAISVPTERQTASRTFAEKGVAYGVPGVRVDGNDLFAVIAVTRDAIRRASAGEGPTLIEAITYRMGGHSTSDDPTRYRDKSLLDPWADRDPLARIKRYLDKQGWFTEAEEQKLRTEIDARLRDVVEAAEKTPAPSLESMFDDVYASLPWHLREQRAEVLAGPRAPSAHH